VCRITRSHISSENTSVAPLPPQSEPIAPENITAWERGRRARMPGAQALRPHTAIHSITSAPPGYAGFQPACRVHRHCARIQRYTPSPLHRLGARASSPHTAIVWVRGLPARIRRYTPSPLHRLGTRASRPHAGGRRRCACFFSPGCASVAPACRIRERLARMPGARAFRPHAAMRPIRGRDALIPRRVCSPRCEQLHNPVLLFHCRDRAILRSDPGRKNAHCCPNDHE
jgi:hypothetical protein